MRLKHVKKACQITDQIFNRLVKNFHFKTELEVADFILKEIKKRGLKPSFPLIVASECNNHQIHHHPKKHKLAGFTILDFGVRHRGYCSDMTRTIFIGRPKKSDLNIYARVLKTQQNCIKKIKVGQPYQDLDAYARVQFQPYQTYFKHSLGHGVGRKIHQKPKISPHSKDIVKLGDIITIEPGLYKKNKFGIRIEDTVYVGKKIRALTKSPKKLFIFPKIYKL